MYLLINMPIAGNDQILGALWRRCKIWT